MEGTRRVTAAALLAALCLAAFVQAGPLPNVTATDIVQKEGGCLVGDVVYGSSEEVPGATPCERCRCAGGAVRCDAVSCDPRPGCKALHRPDHCCPIYQCECEQEGRVYGNGEKLVDPLDPCRVCYCQGGEVVCRRIACFLRDDCRPRRVPGRCCPEYDNCPLRGVSTVPGATGNSSLMPSDAAPPLLDVKQEITIKEITPVSEIPIVTDVKIKEIIPSPSIEVFDYTSSKSPLFAREVNTEKSSSDDSYFKTETPGIIEVHPSTTAPSSLETTRSDVFFVTVNSSEEVTSSKMSLSTQGSINSEIYPSKASVVASSVEPPPVPVASLPTALATSTSKAAVVEDDDPTMLDHNPAFPPIPDDLSVIGSNHDDETMPSQVIEGNHAAEVTYDTNTSHVPPTFTEAIKKESITTLTPEIIVTNKIPDLISTPISTSTHATNNEESMLNLRSAIPSEILNVPSSLPEDINGELDESVETMDTNVAGGQTTSKNTEYSSTYNYKTTLSTATNALASNDLTTLVYPDSTQQKNKGVTLRTIITEGTLLAEKQTLSAVDKMYTESTALPTTYIPTEDSTKLRVDTVSTVITLESSPSYNEKNIETSTLGKVSIETTVNPQGPFVSTTYMPKISPEMTSQTELSSIPIETSDQNPQESIKEKISISTSGSFVTDTPKVLLTSPEIVTVYRELPTTTEFVLTSFGSSESVTDAVELIKISADAEKNADIISEPARKTNCLEDLNNLVGEFASIGHQNDVTKQTAAPLLTGSEEFIPVNAGYKSKNNNYNVNSITEVPIKNKKQKIEIDDDDTNISDALPPHDKVEPTTRLPIIDNVSHDAVGNKSAKNDIEILTQSYVPTISRKPTKVMMSNTNRTSSDEFSRVTVSSVETAAMSTVATHTVNLPTTTIDTGTIVSNLDTIKPSPSMGTTTTITPAPAQ